jgi:hypothetical protein
MNKITDKLNNKPHALAIFCELYKTFDTVDHVILLKKLANLGVRVSEPNWLKNYLP